MLNLKKLPETAASHTNNLFGALINRGYLFECLMDERRVRLPFASRQSVQNFARFIDLYVNDFAPGNSYNGIFPQPYSKPQAIFFSQNGPAIDHERLQTMTAAICHKRLGLVWYEPVPKQVWETAAPILWQTEGWNHCYFDERRLPPRQKPKTGDLVRVVDDPGYRRVDAYFIGELREQEKSPQAMLAIIGNDDLPKFVTVPMEKVMKIRNMWKESSAWWQHYSHTHLQLLHEAKQHFQLKLDNPAD